MVIDDAAVTPRYVVGFAAARELPIVKRIAVGSLRNKLLFLLPAALALSALAPRAITPLLVLGGAFLCYEGAEKVWEMVHPHAAHQHEEKTRAAPSTPQTLEDERVAGAIRTDFILSAEIMAISLATVSSASFAMQGVVLAAVAVGITALVYGVVAMIVKADDAGAAMARTSSGLVASLGRLVVLVIPPFLVVLSGIGTAAMLWVGGGIVIHGLEEFGLTWLGHWMHEVAGSVGGLLGWLAGAGISGAFGLLLGALVILLVERVLGPLFRLLRQGQGRRSEPGA